MQRHTVHEMQIADQHLPHLEAMTNGRNTRPRLEDEAPRHLSDTDLRATPNSVSRDSRRPGATEASRQVSAPSGQSWVVSRSISGPRALLPARVEPLAAVSESESCHPGTVLT